MWEICNKNFSGEFLTSKGLFITNVEYEVFQEYELQLYKPY